MLDFLMGYESYLRKRRISVSSRRYKPIGKYRSVFAQRFSRSQPMRESTTFYMFFFFEKVFVENPNQIDVNYVLDVWNSGIGKI
jgi:hypothetical protein